MSAPEDLRMPARELSISFGYQCNPGNTSNSTALVDESNVSSGITRSSSFTCLSGAALNANATLANTNICNGLIGEEILPSLDSPKSFRRMTSSPSLSWIETASLFSLGSMTSLGGSASSDNDVVDIEMNLSKSLNAPSRTESSSFLSAMDVQMAGGAAGEDRVQAVCSEENGWLFCGIYDGFNGRDAADFLAGTLYENIGFYLHKLEWQTRKQKGSLKNASLRNTNISPAVDPDDSIPAEEPNIPYSSDTKLASDSFRLGVIDCLSHALAQAENDFMCMVEQEMEDRLDLVCVGSCVLAVLLHGNHLYVLNLGDSRAVLATSDTQKDGSMTLRALQLTETHTVDNESERRTLLAYHPEDPCPIINGRVKGKLKLTRAFGVGYLKKSKMNDMLMGILRVRNLSSPPYVYTQPSIISHRVSDMDQFVILGSDGLFDFFSNDEVVQLVHMFIQHDPFGDPAKHLVEQLVQRAADNAGFSAEELMGIPAGRRRKYHDDVTAIVIILGNKQRTTAASTAL